MAEAILRQRCGQDLDPGFIYVAQMEGHGVYKIGRSSNVPRRMSEIGIQLPFPYRLCFAHKVLHVHFMESDLHRDLSHLRKNGEWFELSERTLRAIKLKLIYAQSEWLTQRLVDRFNADDLYPDILRQYGRLFSNLGRRNDRRLNNLVDAEHDLIDEFLMLDVLSAEIVT